jgi:hypothetical protein
LAVLRACLTNLAHLSDADMLNTDFSLLIQLNKAAIAPLSLDMQHRLPDPGLKILKNLTLTFFEEV